MEKIQIIDNIDNLIMQGEEVLKTKRYHNYEFFAGDYVDTDLFNEWKCQIDIFLSTDSKFKTAKDSFDETVGMSTNYEYSKRYIGILKALKTSIEKNIISF